MEKYIRIFNELKEKKQDGESVTIEHFLAFVKSYYRHIWGPDGYFYKRKRNHYVFPWELLSEIEKREKDLNGMLQWFLLNMERSRGYDRSFSPLAFAVASIDNPMICYLVAYDYQSYEELTNDTDGHVKKYYEMLVKAIRIVDQNYPDVNTMVFYDCIANIAAIICHFSKIGFVSKELEVVTDSYLFVRGKDGGVGGFGLNHVNLINQIEKRRKKADGIR